MKKYYLFAGLVLLGASPGFAQVKIGATGAPDGSAMLEVTSGTSGNRGLLLPRMTLTQRDAIPAPATGLMIYNTTANQVQVNTGTPAAPIWVIATATNSGWNLVGNNGTTPATNFIGTTDNQPLVVRTNNTEKLRVTAAGQLGIGTITPSSKLEVSNGGITVTPGATPLTKSVIAVVNNGGGAGLNDDVDIFSYGTNTAPSWSTWTARGTASAPVNSEPGDNAGILRFGTQIDGDATEVNRIQSIYVGDGTTVKSKMMFSTNGAAANTVMTIDSSANVGIGTTTPLQKLHVQGAARISTAVGTPTTITGRNAAGDLGNVTLGSGLALTGGVLNTTADNADWNLIGNTGTNPATNFIGTGDAQPLVIRTSNVEQLRVTAAGDIGIGTTAPAQTLHVQGTARIATAVGTPTTITGRNAAGDMGNVTLGAGLTLTGGALTTTPDSDDWNLIGNTGTNPATNFIGTGDAQPLVIRTSNVEQLRVTAAGDVGIGVTTPAQTLHVQGTARIATAVGTPTTITGRNAAGDVGNVTLGAGLTLTGGALTTTPDGDDWNLTGNTGTNPATNFIGTGDAQPLVIRTGNVEQIRVTAAGDVGIGTNAPTQTLDVAGTARIRTVAGTPTTIAGRNAAGDVGAVTLGSGLALTAGILNTTADNADWNLTGNTGTNPATNFIGTGDAQPLVIRTSNVEQLRVTAAGDMGIGTAAPAQTLHVQGTARIATAVGTPTTITGRNAAGDVGNVTVGSGLALTAGVLTAAPVADNTDWNITGNTGTNPSANFIGTSDNQALAIRTNNAEQVRVTGTGDVGIGTQNPSSKLNVSGGSLNVSTTAAISSAAIEVINDGGGSVHNDDILISSYGASTSPAFNTFSAGGTAAAPANLSSGQILTAVNATGQVNGNNPNLGYIRITYIGDGTTRKSRMTFNTGGGNADMSLDSSGYVGIGTQTPTARLSVNGASNNTTGTWGIFSDARVKTVDGEFEDGLATVLKIHPVKFHYKANAPFKSADQQIGIIAQEMEQIAPYMVTKIKAEGFDDLRQYNNQALPYMMVNAIQELHAQIETLKAENKALKENKAVTVQLMERMKQMEQMMGIKEIEGTSKVAGK